MQELQELEEKEALTFRPQVQQRQKNEGNSRLSVAERNRIWQENKEKKLELIKEQKKDDGLEECTFQPVFATKQPMQRNSDL